MSLQSRDIEVLNMPLAPGAQVLRPERAVLVFGDAYSFDVGAFCYAKRSAPVGPRKGIVRPRSERLVDPASFEKCRVPIVRNLLTYASDLMSVQARRPSSTFFVLRHFAGFIEWAEANGYGDVLTNRMTLRPAFSAYVEHLRHRVNTGQVAQNTAAIAQNTALGVVSELRELDNLAHGLNLLRINKHARTSTEPPSVEAQARVLALCESLFDGLAELCLLFRPYPYALPVPGFIGAADNQLWTFPTRKWCMAPHEIAVRGEGQAGYWVYDYLAGQIAANEDVQHHYVKSKKSPKGGAAFTRASALKNLQRANDDPHHVERRNAAKLAHNAFIVLFLSRTGMNWATVQELRWSDTYELGTERQGFRTVKYRAGGKQVSFEIQAGFLPRFRRFLELRAYLLNGTDYDRLFLSAQNGAKRFEPLKAKALTAFFDSLRRLDPNVPDIKSKQWRAGKSDWLLRTTDVSTTAVVLQNSEATVLASYAAGSPTTQSEELSAFFESVQSAVLDRNEVVPGGETTAVGVCASSGNPAQTLGAPIAPDCKAPEGCLFCDKFRIHADETDVRKLLSCRYCIEQSAPMVVSEEHYQVLFGPILRRIGSLLADIDKHAPGLVARIEKDVENGELDPYWEGKLEMLVDLELVG